MGVNKLKLKYFHRQVLKNILVIHHILFFCYFSILSSFGFIKEKQKIELRTC